MTGPGLSIALLTAALLLPAAAVDVERCDELRRKMARGAGLTNAEQNESLSCPGKDTRRPITALPKPKGEDPYNPRNTLPPDEGGTGKPSGGPAGGDGF